jgi:NAD-dependent deacetylase
MSLNLTIKDQIRPALELIRHSNHTIALTGAGISTASGIPDFRSSGSGLWGEVDPFEVASIVAFRRRPQDFYAWIHPIAQLIVQAEPNAAHLALAQLETKGQLQAIITQNVDMLHSKAGSKSVYEVHGHFRSVTCLQCYLIHPSEKYLDSFIVTGEMPYCESCGGILKPDLILMGEQLPVGVLTKARQLSRECEVMLVAGSSLEMAPVGELPRLAVESGARLIIVNLEPTQFDHLADVVIWADVVDVLPELNSNIFMASSLANDIGNG